MGAALGVSAGFRGLVPLHEAGPPPRGAAGPRLLLLSYHFPPGQSAGALRWQKLTRHAAEWGWGVDVVTAHPASLRAVDTGRLCDLPDGTRVYGVPQPDVPLRRLEEAAGRVYRRLRALGELPARVRRETAAPAGPTRARPASLELREIRWSLDSRSLIRGYHACLAVARERQWAERAAEVGMGLVDADLHRAVITCGPPHMIHVAGARLSRAYDLPLVMDLRDPWSIPRRLPEAHASPLWFALAAHFERRAVMAATLVVANTDPVRREMEARYPSAPARFLTVLNGYDEDPVPPPAESGRFIVAYAGGIYLDRDPATLLRGAAKVVRELGLTPDQLGIEFIGQVEGFAGRSVADMAREEGIGSFVTVGPPRPHRDAMEFLARGALLVSLPQDSPWAIPSKVYEYMKFHAWLLALSEPGGPVAELLGGTGADVVAPHDVEGIACVLRKRFEQFMAGARPPRLAIDHRLSRRYQSSLLFRALRDCLGERGVAAPPPPAASVVA